MILVVGGTGFVGSRVVDALLAAKFPIKVMTRGTSDWNDQLFLDLKALKIDVVVGDLRNRERLDAALSGCTAVINLSGIFRQHAHDTFQNVHVEGMRNLVAACHEHQIQRFIHLSCLGSAGQATSEYMRSRFAGEEILRKSQFWWTILRSSVIFGDGSPFFMRLKELVRLAPVLPVIDSGLNCVQPIWVENVSECVIQSIYNKETAHKTIDLVGPETYNTIELLQLMSKVMNVSKPTFNVPYGTAKNITSLIQRFKPDSNYTIDMLNTLLVDQTGDAKAMQSFFKVKMMSLTENLNRIGTRES